MPRHAEILHLLQGCQCHCSATLVAFHCTFALAWNRAVIKLLNQRVPIEAVHDFNARLDASKTLKVASPVDGKAAAYLVRHSLQQLPFEQLLRLPAVATFSSQRQRCFPHAVW